MSRFFFILLLTAMTVMPVMAATLDEPVEEEAAPERSRPMLDRLPSPPGTCPPIVLTRLPRPEPLSDRQPWTGQGRVGLQSWQRKLGPPPLSHRDLGPVPIVVDGVLWPTHEPTRLHHLPAGATRQPHHRS